MLWCTDECNWTRLWQTRVSWGRAESWGLIIQHTFLWGNNVWFSGAGKVLPVTNEKNHTHACAHTLGGSSKLQLSPSSSHIHIHTDTDTQTQTQTHTHTHTYSQIGWMEQSYNKQAPTNLVFLPSFYIPAKSVKQYKDHNVIAFYFSLQFSITMSVYRKIFPNTLTWINIT